MRFTKMQGLGNDYIYVNCFEETVHSPAELAVRMSRPHYGVGSDGLVLMEPSDVADIGMRIFNADGSESEMCGNAIRCVAKYAYERGLVSGTSMSLMTPSGLCLVEMRVAGGLVNSVRVDMGTPELNPAKIPVNLSGEIVLGHRLDVGGMNWPINCVSTGNPHCVIFVQDPDLIDLSLVGPLIESNPIFPRRTNVEFAVAEDREHLRMRVWERGTGETLACGSGACAVLVAAVLSGKCNREALVQLAGGPLHVLWSPEDNHLYQEGPAEFVYDGVWPD